MGTLTDGFAAAYDETTMTGALEKMLDDLATNHSDKRVAYVFPHGGMFGSSENWYKTYKPAILAALKNGACPTLTLRETTRLWENTASANWAIKYTSDGTHPNAAGYERFLCRAHRSAAETAVRGAHDGIASVFSCPGWQHRLSPHFCVREFRCKDGSDPASSTRRWQNCWSVSGSTSENR